VASCEGSFSDAVAGIHSRHGLHDRAQLPAAHPSGNPTPSSGLPGSADHGPRRSAGQWAAAIGAVAICGVTCMELEWLLQGQRFVPLAKKGTKPAVPCQSGE